MAKTKGEVMDFEEPEIDAWKRFCKEKDERIASLEGVLKRLREYPHCIKCCQDIDKALQSAPKEKKYGKK